MNPGAEKEYALDFESVLRHVVTELGGTSVPLSVDAMADSWRPSVPSDLSRVMTHHDIGNRDEAKRFLIGRAVESLKWYGQREQIVSENGGYRLADGVPADDVRYGRDHGRKIVPNAPPSPFDGIVDPNTGAIEDMLSRTDKVADEELRESLVAHGWLEHLPRIMSANGVILVGNRRTRIAKELGIAAIPTRTFVGTDGEATVLAIASNVGTAKMKPENRRKIEQRLALQNFTQQEIAALVKVSQKTVSQDLAKIIPGYNSTGRQRRPRNLTDEQAAQIATLVLDEGKAILDAEKMVRGPEFAEKVRPSSSAMKVIDREVGRREALAVLPTERAEPTPATEEPAPTQESTDPPTDVPCRCPKCGHEHAPDGPPR